ncbi:ABC transporter permease [Crenalkalicoccus roseus]|uniref:ABC transporter permease n=1 Tax=Crenalkalicoccus roseus TaxID=1485588 RepID=UPI0010822BD2|nr:ABC transporter permease [Crenalkalicoccus roseus]
MSASVLAPPAAAGARWPRPTPGLRAAARRLAAGAGGLAALLLLWWAGIALFTAPEGLGRAFGPVESLASLARMLAEGEVLTHAGVSLRRVLVGLGVALAVGVPLGLAVGAWRGLEAATTPAFQFLRMISPLSWMPIAVMVLGVGDAPVHVLLAFAAVWPIMLNTAAGVRALDARWMQLARSLSATWWETLRRVVLPGVLGHVLTGVRLAIGILWIVLVPCEMLGVSAGLGYAILDARDRLAYSELMALVLLIGALGFALDAAARALYRLRGG